MNTTLVIAKIAALISVVVLCLSLARTAQYASKVMVHTDLSLTEVDLAVKRSNLLMKQASFAVLSLGETAFQLRQASRQEAGELDGLNSKVQQTLADLDMMVVTSTRNSTELMQTANATLKGVQPILSETQNTVRQAGVATEKLTDTMGHVDALVQSPDVTKTLSNVQKSSAATADTMVSVKATAGDLQEAAHKYLHPSWPGKIANWTLKVVRAINPL